MLHSKLVRRKSVITKVKNTVAWTYVISDLSDKEIVGTFYEIEIQKHQKDFRIEKAIKIEGDIKYMTNGKFTIIHLIIGLIKKILLYKIELFSTL